jgi:uncharacterized membrane protein
MDNAENKMNLLITAKQYKLYLLLYIGISTIMGVTFLGGMLIIMLSTEVPYIIAGVITVICSAISLIVYSLIFIFKYSFKLQLYREYKKHPENFDEVNE